jgi:hypothetical protein
LAEQDYYSKGEQIAQDFKELAAANPEKFTAWIPKNDPVKRREYVLADGWQYIGARFGVFASTSLIERSEDGFIVECILATNDGIKVGSGIGICQLYDAEGCCGPGYGSDSCDISCLPGEILLGCGGCGIHNNSGRRDVRHRYF